MIYLKQYKTSSDTVNTSLKDNSSEEVFINKNYKFLFLREEDNLPIPETRFYTRLLFMKIKIIKKEDSAAIVTFRTKLNNNFIIILS